MCANLTETNPPLSISISLAVPYDRPSNTEGTRSLIRRGRQTVSSLVARRWFPNGDQEVARVVLRAVGLFESEFGRGDEDQGAEGARDVLGKLCACGPGEVVLQLE